jgi:hypothetical protein
MIDPALLEELRRFVNAHKLPEYMSDLVGAVPDHLVKQIVQDFRSYNPHPTQDPNAKVTPVGAGRTVTAGENVPPRGNGWTDPPQVNDWTPPGLREMDAMMDEADRRDRAARIRELAGTQHALNLAKAAAEAATKAQEEQPKERKDKEHK